MSKILPPEILDFIVSKIDGELSVDLGARRDFIDLLEEGNIQRLKPIIRFSAATTLNNVQYEKSSEDEVYREIATALKLKFKEETPE